MERELCVDFVTEMRSSFACSPMVQFQLLHSKFHLCSVATRGLLLSTYIKFVNLFPEIKNHIQDVSLSSCFLFRSFLNLILKFLSGFENEKASRLF